MNILLLGKTGLLGSEFLQILQRKSCACLPADKNNAEIRQENTDLTFIAPNRIDFDVLDFAQVDDILTDNFIIITYT
jgi:dTDP-4-dehydrorhamnose reductase